MPEVVQVQAQQRGAREDGIERLPDEVLRLAVSSYMIWVDPPIG
jgi:hypothetical protein